MSKIPITPLRGFPACSVRVCVSASSSFFLETRMAENENESKIKQVVYLLSRKKKEKHTHAFKISAQTVWKNKRKRKVSKGNFSENIG